MTTQLSPLQLSVLPNAQMNPAYSATSTMEKNATYCNTLTTRSSLEILRRSNTYNNNCRNILNASKFIKPKDFLGLDLTHKEPGEITLSMETFSTKMEQVLNLQDTFPGDVFAPGRADKKVIRGKKLEENKEYRSHVGTLNWLCMGVRYDVV
jgi:hypothetical protein